MGNNPYDLIIVGAGPAGMTAAVYAGRKGLKTLVISKDTGGQVNWTTLVENYMGFEQIQGPELIERFNRQMQEGEDLTYKEDEVDRLEVKEDLESLKVFTVNGRNTG